MTCLFQNSVVLICYFVRSKLHISNASTYNNWRKIIVCMYRECDRDLIGDLFDNKEMVGWLGPILSRIYGFWHINIPILHGT